MLSGKWTYRSFVNDQGLVGDDAQKALNLIFGEGVFTFTESGPGRFHGTLDMGQNYVLNLSGEVRHDGPRSPESYHIIGEGVAGSPTAGWRYDYQCARGYHWPDGIDQIPSLVGTVVRVKAHGPQSPAGVTASFIAVHQSKSAPA